MAKPLAKSTKKLSVLLFIASMAGIVISASLLKEDVLSTAHTLTVYFPQAFGVTPAITEEGGLYLGIFISIVQIVGAAVAGADHFPRLARWTAFIVMCMAIPFDAWTDIVYRSGYLQGNLVVATITTIAFYTFGSEIMQALSLMLFFSVWRQALADTMWGVAYGWHSMSTTKKEWENFLVAAKNYAARESQGRIQEKNQPYAPTHPTPPAFRPSSPARPVQTPMFGRPAPTYHPVQHDEPDD